jgi:queuine tRNA-ribosyltransferase subunit QTRTD1
LIIETTVELPPEKPRVLSKVSSPEGVFHAVEAGVDLVDGSYPYVLSERGHAMYWSRKGELAPPKYTERDLKLGSTVDLNENVYGGQYSPLVEHCTCYTCQNHTRSYLHHLLVTKELLAGVLLMIHNLHQYLNFFNDLRVAVKEDRYLSYRTLFSTKF